MNAINRHNIPAGVENLIKGMCNIHLIDVFTVAEFASRFGDDWQRWIDAITEIGFACRHDTRARIWVVTNEPKGAGRPIDAQVGGCAPERLTTIHAACCRLADMAALDLQK